MGSGEWGGGQNRQETMRLLNRIAVSECGTAVSSNHQNNNEAKEAVNNGSLKRHKDRCCTYNAAGSTRPPAYPLVLDLPASPRFSTLQLPKTILLCAFSPAAKGKSEELGGRAGQQIRAVPRKRRV